MQVHEQYTLYAHFLLGNAVPKCLLVPVVSCFGSGAPDEQLLMARAAPKVRFYMNQDSGSRAAFMTASHHRVKERTADAWYVRVLKESTIDEKDAAVSATKKRLNAYLTASPGLSEYDVQVLMVMDEMMRMKAIGHWGASGWPIPLQTRVSRIKGFAGLLIWGTTARTTQHVSTLRLRYTR